MMAALISLIIGIWKDGIGRGWIEGVTIWIAVIIVVSVSAGNNYIKEQQFQELLRVRKQRTITASRNGSISELNIHELLVGDIIHIRSGECLPVDAILLSGSSIEADESSITGEVENLHKLSLDDIMQGSDNSSTPFLIAGTSIVNGKGIGVVCNVGESSTLGKMNAKVFSRGNQEEPTILQQKLEKIAHLIGIFGVWAAVITVTGLIFNLLVSNSWEGVSLFRTETVKQIVSYVILGITIIVVAVPEGLPLAVTIALAYSVGKMKDKNNLVRKLQSCETMGGANNICSDKTGTLTQNQMEVVAAYFDMTYFDHTEISSLYKLISPHTLEALCHGICVNSTAFLMKDSITGEEIKSGNPTECALLKLSAAQNYHYEDYRDKELFMIPFSSKRKRMTSVIQIEENTVRVFCKGASELILEKCEKYLGVKGEQKMFHFLEKEKIELNIISKFASDGMRTVTLAYKDLSVEEFELQRYTKTEDQTIWEELESNLILIGIVGIMDPIRDDVPEAVRKCNNAGINVRMITGDNINTAKAIARKAGILSKTDEHRKFACMEGFQFRQMCGGLILDENNTECVSKMSVFRMITDDLKVLARSSPEDKYLLVTGLKQDSNIVAVTGDGTNDAPALKKANVGFAMGKCGTEIAKEAADIILLDDNFSSIVTACKWGRNIYDSIRKFLQFQLTVNIVAIFMVFIGGVVLGESPFTSVQMLWVNLIMDTFASLALATEPPSDTLLNQAPYSKDEFIISPFMLSNILSHSFYQILVLSFLLFSGPNVFIVYILCRYLDGRQGRQLRYGLWRMGSILLLYSIPLYLCKFSMK